MIQVLLIVLGSLAALLGFAATKPATFRIERNTSIDAPPEKIFPLINDFHRWKEWSPFEKLDPALKRTHSSALNGKGAVYAWEGNSKAGAGRMEITDTSPPSQVTIQLDFTKPFKASNTAKFTLEGKGDSTKVTWAMDGPNLYVSKVMGIFVNMDKLIGKDFETGLANIKSIAET